ncbi:MAG: hypothetical protein GX799_08325 [Crenarchaeota archaeon]|jgi:hypothetical protein|nr:hypothetical protein [Thermoproteota archaeon]
MNARKIGSTLGLGLMLVALLSLIAMPALAAPASTSHSRGHNCGHGSFYVYVVGYFDSGAPSVFYDGATSPQYYGYTVNSYSDTITSTIVYADGTGTCTTCGLHVRATAWVSPITYPLTHGGSVETWE